MIEVLISGGLDPWEEEEGGGGKPPPPPIEREPCNYAEAREFYPEFDAAVTLISKELGCEPYSWNGIEIDDGW